MSENILPGFTWDERIARYRVLTSGYGQRAGTFVARSKVLALLEQRVDQSRDLLADITQAFYAGEMSGKQWQLSFAGQLKILYLQEASLGAGGWDRLTSADYGRIGGYLRGEYGRLTGFAQDILDENITEAQALARARMYGGKGRGMFWSTDRRAQRLAGKREERRLLGEARHCSVCPDYAAAGWQPIGYNPLPGTHGDCWGHCYCDLEYR